jgi:hypothetical protein
MKMKQVTVICAFAALVAGCANQGAQPATAAVSVGPSFAAVEGKAFFLFRAGNKCGGPMPGSPLIASWVDKVEVVEGRLVRWGSRCGGEGLPVSDEERGKARLNSDGSMLTLGGVVYRQSANPIKEAESLP